MNTHDIARMLRDQFGPEAVNVATRKQRAAAEANKHDEAKDWEQVRKFLREGRTPVAS